MNEIIKPDDKAAEAVCHYAQEIVAAVKLSNFEVEVEVEYIEAVSADNKLSANSAYITTDLGVVVVFPNFKRKNAMAAILNAGLVRCMEREGYDDDYIEKNGKIYSKLLPCNKENVNMFGYYLTHKVDIKNTNTKL
jgi:hypothetical protein